MQIPTQIAQAIAVICIVAAQVYVLLDQLEASDRRPLRATE